MPVAEPVLRAVRVPFDRRSHPLGRARGREPLGDPVLALGVPARVVGWLRRQRPRRDARRGAADGADDARWPSSRSCTATRWSPTTSSSGPRSAAGGPAADPRRAGREGGVLRGLVPLRLRDAAGRPGDLPAVADALAAYCAGRATPGTRCRGTRSTCGGSAAATPRSTPSPRPSGPARPPRAGRSASSARTCARSSAAGGRHDRRLPLHAGQEGAPRDPAQGPARRGRGRGPARGLRRPARGPAGVHRPPPAALGRGRPVPRQPGRRAQPGVRAAAVRAVRPTGRCACRSSRSGTAGSRRGSRSRPPTRCSTTTPGWTRTPASCRRAC